MRRSIALLVAVLASLVLAAGAGAQAPLPPASEIAQDVTLQQAAQAGIAHLKAKGGFGGDVVAVDLDGALIHGLPVTARVRIEFSGTDKAGQPWTPGKAQQIADAIDARLKGIVKGIVKGSDGTPVQVDVIPSVRAPGAPPTPGYHQIELIDVPDGGMTNMVHTANPGPNGEMTGEWSANISPTTYAHETLHLLGFHDRYSAREPEEVINGKRYPLPPFTGDRDDQAALDKWWDSVVAESDRLEAKHGKGKIEAKIPKGLENDLLANTKSTTSTLGPADADALIARAGTHLTARPGDVLVNKNGTAQNLGVGAPLDLYAPRGGTAHADGIYAYCIDLHRHAPATGEGYDVLGAADALGDAQLGALSALLQEIARRQEPGTLLGVPGAQDAVWAITDASQPGSTAMELLGAAGVAYDQATAVPAPHFDNANAAAPDTGAVTPTGVLPAVAADRTPAPTTPVDRLQPAVLPKPGLLRATLTTRKGRRAATLRVATLGEQTTVRLGLLRQGRRRETPLGTIAVPSGITQVTVKLPRTLKRGRHRLVLHGAEGGWTARVAFRRR